MSDLLAECDWHDSTLFLVLPEDPERIGVRLFPSRHAPSRMYVPEAEIVRTKDENAKLRELAIDMISCFDIGARSGEGISRQRCRELCEECYGKIRKTVEVSIHDA